MLLFEIETKLYTNLYLSQFILWSIEICIYVHVLVHIYNQLTTHRKKLPFFKRYGSSAHKNNKWTR